MNPVGCKDSRRQARQSSGAEELRSRIGRSAPHPALRAVRQRCHTDSGAVCPVPGHPCGGHGGVHGRGAEIRTGIRHSGDGCSAAWVSQQTPGEGSTLDYAGRRVRYVGSMTAPGLATAPVWLRGPEPGYQPVCAGATCGCRGNERSPDWRTHLVCDSCPESA